MRDLSNQLLIQAYDKAKQLNLQKDFIQLIEAEMKKRNLRLNE